MAHWRALQVHPQRETQVERALYEYAVPAFCPRFHIRLHRPGSPIAARPLFPGYLFADIERPFDGAQGYAIVKRCNWVVAILGTMPIPPPVIDAIRKASENVCVSPQWIPGHLYRLKQPHALGDILVRLEALDTPTRASVILHLFGAERAVSVHVSDLEEQ